MSEPWRQVVPSPAAVHTSNILPLTAAGLRATAYLLMLQPPSSSSSHRAATAANAAAKVQPRRRLSRLRCGCSGGPLLQCNLGGNSSTPLAQLHALLPLSPFMCQERCTDRRKGKTGGPTHHRSTTELCFAVAFCLGATLHLTTHVRQAANRRLRGFGHRTYYDTSLVNKNCLFHLQPFLKFCMRRGGETLLFKRGRTTSSAWPTLWWWD